MAYATEITRDTIVKMVLRTVRGLDLGVSPSETQEDEVEQFLNIAIKAFDGVGWFRQMVAQETSGALTAADASLTVSADAHSVMNAYYFATGDGTAHEIEIVSPKECFSHGPIHAKGVPSHACFIKPDTNAGVLYFNRRIPADGTLMYTYRQPLIIISGDTVKFITSGLGEEFLMTIVLMVSVDMAPAFALQVTEIQEIKTQLAMQIQMLKSGQMMINTGSIATLSGQVPPVPLSIDPSNL